MEIIVRGRHITVPARFRQHAAAKLAKLEKLDQKAVRVDVEVSKERNPRQSDRRERVELTIRSRGPAIRAEAAADDRYAALDLAFAKLESRLRRACDRRKGKKGDNDTLRSPAMLADAGPLADAAGAPAAGAAPGDLAGPALNGDATARPRAGQISAGHARAEADRAEPDGAEPDSHLVPIQMEGDGPLVVREKVHAATPMTIDQALLEMELVGHDFYLFHDSECDRFSVVYRRRGYDYGVIRLVEE
jgi:ribosomal subunit interface protein